MTETAPLDVERIARAYINVRNKRHELAAEFKQKEDELVAVQDRLSAAMLSHLNKHGADSIRTAAGTIFRQEAITPSASDWQAFYNWIKEHDAFEALERRIKKTFVADYMDANNGEMPPGVSVHREYVVRVRKPK